ncbi:hypothetical protein Tco_0824772 [Tanacetum coccineum]|uniref:Uncharacterized protein n=1 Tax=Tanacetum coccineum TaxID=301880 RepID=A0ABQ5AR10_9ASTR
MIRRICACSDKKRVMINSDPGIEYGRELQIGELHINADFLLELNKKMEKPHECRCVTERNKAEIKKVINKLEKNINDLIETIKDMSNQAFENYAVIFDA